MASTIYYVAASLDGYIADPDDGLDWLTGYEGSSAVGDGAADPMGEGGSYERFYEGVGAMVSGSVTYEWVLDHLEAAGGGKWPYGGKPFWVLSSREQRRPEGENADVRVANGPVAELHEELTSAAGDHALWVVGGGGVASQFADAGLLDELQLTVVPVILGAGKPLFDRPLPGDLELIGATPFSNGMTELRYRIRS